MGWVVNYDHLQRPILTGWKLELVEQSRILVWTLEHVLLTNKLCFFSVTLYPAGYAEGTWKPNVTTTLRSYYDICVPAFPSTVLRLCFASLSKQCNENKYKFYFLEWQSNPQPVAFTNAHLRPCDTTGLI